MKRILIVGASSEKSIGYLVGEQLKKKGHDALYASRGGKLGEKCDLCIQSDVLRLFRTFKPEVVIQAAGVFTAPQKLGRTTMRSEMADHMLAKSYGTISLLNAAVRVGSVRNVIMLGGRAVSSDPRFAVCTAANGALWALTQFAARHLSDHFATYYIDLPLVENSAMGLQFFPASAPWPKGSVSDDEIAAAIEKIPHGKHNSGDRIVLGDKSWTV